MEPMLPATLSTVGVAALGQQGEVLLTVSGPMAEHVRAHAAEKSLVALHEAGHLLQATLHGVAVDGVETRLRSGGATRLSVGLDTQVSFTLASALRDRIVIALGGLAAEIELLGEGTDGSKQDVAHATQIALDLVEAGLAGEPFVATGAFGFGATPPAIANAVGRTVLGLLATARIRAQELAHEHRDQILALAEVIAARRRLDPDDVADALRQVGLEPPASGAARWSGHTSADT